jgi:hypothetical protein
LERDQDALLESLVAVTPEALDGLALEERHRIYRIVKQRASSLLDGGIEECSNTAPVDEAGTLEVTS